MRKLGRLLLITVFLAICAVGNVWDPALEATAGPTSNGQVRIDNVHEVAITPDGSELWAYGCHNSHIVVVDIESQNYEIIGEVEIPGSQRAPISHIIFSADGSYAYLANALQFCEEGSCDFGDYDHVVVVDTATRNVISTIPMQEPYSLTGSLALSQDETALYLTVADYPGGREGIYKLDLSNGQMIDFLEVPGVNFITRAPDGNLFSSRGWGISGPSPNLFSIINTSSFQIVSSVAVENGPRFIAVSPDGQKAYVANQFSNDISIIALASMTVTTSIPVGPAPKEIAITPDGSKAFVGNEGGIGGYAQATAVSLIDLDNDLFVKDIQVDLEPASVAIDPSGTRIYTSDGNSNGRQASEVHVIDVASEAYVRAIILRPPAFYTPTGIDVTPNGQRLFVIAEATRELLVVDTTDHTIVARKHIVPRAVKVSGDGQRVYVFSPHYPPTGQGSLLTLDADTLDILDAINLEDTSTSGDWDSVVDRIVLNSSEDVAYLTSGDSIRVIAVDLTGRQVLANIPIGAGDEGSNVPARGLAVTPDDAKLFVSNCISQSVSVIDTTSLTITDTVSVGVCPSELEVTSDGSRVYVLQQHTTEMLTILDAHTHTVTEVVHFPAMMAGALDFYLTPDEQYVYIACFDPNWVMRYDLEAEDPGQAIKDLVLTGLDPFNLVTTADKRYLYITNFTSDSISVLDTQTNQIVDTITLSLFRVYLPVVAKGR
jgi:YVTN family beta-propeller protein